MKIAICDDEPRDLEAISAQLSAYAERTGGKLEVNSFSRGNELVRALEGGARFDVLFLDVLMPGLNGLETARELRTLDGAGVLIFLTSSRDFALDAFAVKASDYLIKPVSKATLFHLMDDLTPRLGEELLIVIDEKKGMRRIQPDRIEYCESTNHHLYWHLRSGVVLETRDGIQETQTRLSSTGLFLRVHRSYLVNRDCIRSFNRTNYTVELEHMTQIPIPKPKFSAIQQQYFAMTKGGYYNE